MTEREVTVRLRWEDDRLRAGQVAVGRVSRLPAEIDPWAAFTEGFSAPVTFHATRYEARLAVEAAAIKALGAGDE
jgi:hypothetical protein